jgi:hypothetical protein
MHRPGAIVALHHSFDPTSLVSILVASLRWEAAAAVMLGGSSCRQGAGCRNSRAPKI